MPQLNTVPFETRLEIIKAARERIADKAHWTKGAAARTKYGRGTLPESDNAVRWCGTGALIRECFDRSIKFWWETAAELQPPYFDSIVHVNDHGGHTAILHMFDLAIKRMEAVGDKPKIRYTPE